MTLCNSHNQTPLDYAMQAKRKKNIRSLLDSLTNPQPAVVYDCNQVSLRQKMWFITSSSKLTKDSRKSSIQRSL